MPKGVSTPRTPTHSADNTARTHDVDVGQSAQETGDPSTFHPATPPRVVRTSSKESPKLSSPTSEATAKAAGNLSEVQAQAARESSNSTNQDIAAGASSFVTEAREVREALKKAAENPELKSHKNFSECLAACEQVIKSLEAQVTKLTSLQNIHPQHFPDSPGKEKTLASSIKKMFKNVGSVGATGLMVFSGVAFSLALITGQVYALPLLAMMTAVGYAATHLLLEDEEKEHQAATHHAA